MMADTGGIANFSCQLCGNCDDLRRCSKCKSVYYCSREHQKQDWKVHKKACCVKSAVVKEKHENVEKKEQVNTPVETETAQTAVTENTENTASPDMQSLSDADTEASTVVNLKLSDVPDNVCVKPPHEHIKKESPKNTKSAKVEQTASEDPEGDPFDLSPFEPTSFPKPDEYTFHALSEFASKGLLKDGYCVIDGVLKEDECDKVLKEIKTLDKDGHMIDGKLAGGRTSGVEEEMNVNKKIRSDKIIWLDRSDDDKYPAICGLVSETMDALVGGMNVHVKENIFGRTKAMAACYPGGGSSYHKHVDNPSKDGRLITCIMYLNKDWDVEKSGGFLRVYPSTLPEGKFIDIAPLMNRMIVFWSDWRNPHAVYPAYDTRYAVTVWYFDKAERTAAKTENASKELENVRGEIAVMDIAKKQLEKDVLEQRIENESIRALQKLDASELEAIYGMMALHPQPEEILKQLGIAAGIQKALLHQFKSKKRKT